MPTSIGHAVGGYAVNRSMGRAATGSLGIGALAFLAILVANLPDLDFVPGAIVGEAERFHRGSSHSLMAAFVAMVVLTPPASRVFGGTRRTWALMILAAYGSHLVLDLLVRDPTGGAGIALLWPLSDVRYSLNIPGQHVLDPIRTLDTDMFASGFFGGFLRSTTVKVFLVDGLLILPLVPLAEWWRKLEPVPAPARPHSASADGETDVVHVVQALER